MGIPVNNWRCCCGLDIVVGVGGCRCYFFLLSFATHAWVGEQEAERKRAEVAEAERKRTASKVCACVCARARGLCLPGLHVYVCGEGKSGKRGVPCLPASV